MEGGRQAQTVLREFPIPRFSFAGLVILIYVPLFSPSVSEQVRTVSHRIVEKITTSISQLQTLSDRCISIRLRTSIGFPALAFEAKKRFDHRCSTVWRLPTISSLVKDTGTNVSTSRQKEVFISLALTMAAVSLSSLSRGATAAHPKTAAGSRIRNVETLTMAISFPVLIQLDRLISDRIRSG